MPKNMRTEPVIKSFEKTIPPLDEIKLISKACNWWTVTDDEYRSLFKESVLTLIAYDQKAPIGTMRLISDGVVYGIVVDFLVLPSKRRVGVGKALMKEAIKFSKNQNLKMLKLLATPEGKEFYQKFGFKVRSEKEPGMMLFLNEAKEVF